MELLSLDPEKFASIKARSLFGYPRKSPAFLTRRKEGGREAVVLMYI